MKKYKPLVVALTEPTIQDGYVQFFNSYRQHLMTKAELLVPGDVSSAMLTLVKEAGGVAVRTAKPPAKHLQAADVISRIARDQPDRPVMVIEVGHTVFQHDHLFRDCTDSAVTLTAEGGIVSNDVWNRMQWDDFNASLRGPLRKAAAGDVQIVSAAVAAGPAYLMSVFEYTRFALDARNGGGSTNSATTALADWASSWPWIRVLPPDAPLVAHGHWAFQLGTIFERGVAISNRTGEPYAIFHDWHRVKDVSSQVARIYK